MVREVPLVGDSATAVKRRNFTLYPLTLDAQGSLPLRLTAVAFHQFRRRDELRQVFLPFLGQVEGGLSEKLLGFVVAK